MIDTVTINGQLYRLEPVRQRYVFDEEKDRIVDTEAEWPITAQEPDDCKEERLSGDNNPDSPARNVRVRDELARIISEELVIGSVSRCEAAVDRILDRLIELDVPQERGGGGTIATAVYRGTLRDVKDGEL